MATGGTGGAPVSTQLLGRDLELARIESILEGARSHGEALVVTGEAGIGKSALLDFACKLAEQNGLRVLAAAGVQSETQLSYAGLHQLLQPLLAGLALLPVRLREALLTAFGMTRSEVADRFLTALAALELFANAAHEQPLLVVVEDAHWLDAPTVEALGFIARRIGSEPIILLAAARNGYPNPLTDAHLPQLELPLWTRRPPPPCWTDEARPHAPGPRPHPHRSGRQSVGARRTTHRAAVAARRKRHARATAPLRTPAASIHRPVADLPVATRLLLLVAAANDTDSIAEALRAVSALRTGEVSTECLEPAAAAGLVLLDLNGLRFRHPLVRSAVYQTAALSERRRVHHALADTLVGYPDRRAWHLAASAVAPEESIAEEIMHAAQRAEARGGMAVAVDAFARSAQLSVDPDRRARRLLHAADLALQIGATGRTQTLLADVEINRLNHSERAQVELLRTATEPLTPGDPISVLRLVSAGEQLAANGDVDLSLRFLEAAATQANLADPGKTARAAVSAAALRANMPTDDPRILAILAFAEPEEHGALIIARAARVSAGRADPESAALLGAALNVVGAFDVSSTFLAAAVAGLRDQGRLGRLPLVLTHQAWTGINTMKLNVAVPAAAEAMRLADDLGQPLWRAAAQTAVAMLAALHGDYDIAHTQIRQAEEIALPSHASSMLSGIRLTRGVTALAAGQYDIAYDQLRRLLDRRDPSFHHFQSLWGVGDFAESALHSGHVQAGRALMAELEPLAATVRSPWLQVGLLYARPLLAADEHVETLFEEGLAADLSRWPAYQARLLLQYGIWLRRQRRASDSRSPLRAARDALDALGIVGWAARARQELRASGEPSTERKPEAWSLLSPQELQIAQMAAQGMSNREIGQRLFLSHRTIGPHLYRLFPKLGVTSRAQLSTVIGPGYPS